MAALSQNGRLVHFLVGHVRQRDGQVSRRRLGTDHVLTGHPRHQFALLVVVGHEIVHMRPPGELKKILAGFLLIDGRFLLETIFDVGVIVLQQGRLGQCFQIALSLAEEILALVATCRAACALRS